MNYTEEIRILRSKGTMQYVSLFVNKSSIPNKTYKYTSKIQYQIFYLCLYLSCHDTLKCQKVKLVSFTKGVY